MSDIKIIGFAGKIGAGKTTCANILKATVLGNTLDENGNPVVESIRLNDDGLIVVDKFEDPLDTTGFLNEEHASFCAKYLWGNIQHIDLATPLKSLCNTMFDIPYELLYGNQGVKETLTNITWGDCGTRLKPGMKKTDFMTSRDIMKWVGETFREMSPNKDCWERVWKESVENCGAQMVVLADIRHQVAIDIVNELGGKVIYLLRNYDSGDDHSSENSINKDSNGIAAVLDNKDMDIKECSEYIIDAAVEFGWFS